MEEKSKDILITLIQIFTDLNNNLACTWYFSNPTMANYAAVQNHFQKNT